MSPSRSISGALVPLKNISPEKLKMHDVDTRIIVDIIDDLPIQLPNDRDIFLKLAPGSIEISSNVGLEKVQVLNNEHVQSIEYQANDITVGIVGISGVKKLKIVIAPQKFPTEGITTLVNAEAPIDLLDQYAVLRGKVNRSSEDERKLNDLLKQITREFRSRIQNNDSRIQRRDSYRSTPLSSGEGRASTGSRFSG